MRSHDTVTAALAEVGAYAGRSHRELQEISRVSTVLRVEGGTVLATAGHSGHDFVIVLEGVATVENDGRVVATLGAGDHFGEIAMLDNGPRTATVRAATAMTLAVIGRPEFDDLLDHSPALVKALLTGLVRRVRGTDPIAV
jgi:CRP-like cAMP-binding protein